jgi:DNA-binding PadR family transcriptional regulator
LKKDSLPFSPQKHIDDDDRVPLTYVKPDGRTRSRKPVGDSLWISRKMIDDGCTLEQTLHLMEERCKNCNVLTPMLCVDQCETWKIKKELRETDKTLAESNHRLKLLNTIKNTRRLAILSDLEKRSLSLETLQKRLRKHGFRHSQDTILGYLRPLLETGLVKESDGRFSLTLYGRKIHDSVTKHDFAGRLPTHSSGYEEAILRNLLSGAKTRNQLSEAATHQSLSRTLKRLQERRLIVNNSPSDRVFYFRTKRELSMEMLSPTQTKICEAIPQAGKSARELSDAVGISLRRLYRYLRSLRGKKLVFRREMPGKYELTARGREVAEFLEEIAAIK